MGARGAVCFEITLEEVATMSPVVRDAAEPDASAIPVLDKAPAFMGIVELIPGTDGSPDDVRLIFGSTRHASLVTDGLSADANTRCVRDLGVPQTIVDTWVPQYRIAMEIGESVHFEYESNVQRNGAPVWYAARVQHIHGLRFCFFAEDVTERREIEQALQSSENEYRLLFAANPNPMCVYDRESLAFLAVNDAAVYHYGYTRDEFLNMKVLDLHPPESANEVRALVAAAGDSEHCTAHVVHTKKNGTTIRVETTSSPLRFQGRPARIVSTQDETERLLAEQALRAAETRFRAIVDCTDIAVFCVDTDGRFTYSDGQALASLGLRPGELVGGSVFEVYPGEEALLDLIREVLAGQPGSRHHVLNGVALEIRCTPLYADNGEIIGAIAVAVDVTERERLRAQVLQSDKLASLGQMVAGIAHEVNNPLAAISGNAQLLGFHVDPQVRADARAIREMADRAGRVVRSLLTFARSNPSGSPTGGERERCRMVAMAEEAIALSAATLRQAGIDVTRRMPVEAVGPCVMANPSQIVHILLNLFSNAEHALRQQAPDARWIEIEVTTERGMAVLRVTDTGTGMPADVQRRVFEPFYTTKDVGEGTGLGLALCHSIVEAHGGTITIDSEEGVGTTVSVRLPIVSAMDDASAATLDEDALRAISVTADY
jgi:PAS domain S-box-containing protein